MDPRPFDVPRYLSMLPLFNDLSPAELKHVADACILNRLVRADMVFRLGEPCNEFHVVVTGQVKLFVLSPTGQEKVVELIGPGQSIPPQSRNRMRRDEVSRPWCRRPVVRRQVWGVRVTLIVMMAVAMDSPPGLG